MKKKNLSDRPDRYEDFLDDLGQFYTKDKGKHPVDTADRKPSEKETVLKVGENVREIRKRKGLSLRDISQRTGLEIELLSGIEEGTVAPPLGTIIKLARPWTRRSAISPPEPKSFPTRSCARIRESSFPGSTPRRPIPMDTNSCPSHHTKRIDIWSPFWLHWNQRTSRKNDQPMMARSSSM